MWLQSKNINEVRVNTLCYIEIFFQLVFQVLKINQVSQQQQLYIMVH